MTGAAAGGGAGAVAGAGPVRSERELLADEQARLLVGVDGTPVFVGRDADGVVLGRAAPDGSLVGVRAPAHAVAITASGTELVSHHVADGLLVTTRLDLGGGRSVTTTAAPTGITAVLDVVPGRTGDGAATVLVLVDTASGRWAVTPELRCAVPPDRRPVHVDLARDRYVRVEADGEARHTVLATLGDDVELARFPGVPQDFGADHLLVLLDLGPDDPRPAEDVERVVRVHDLVAGELVTEVALRGYPSAARLLDRGRGVAVVAVAGEERVVPFEVLTGEVGPAHDLPGGRLRVCGRSADGIGIHSGSTLGGSAWIWLSHDGTATVVPGAIGPADVGRSEHRTSGGLPAVVHRPRRSPVAAVVSLHGGPEASELAELRWLGLYRDLLARDVAVVAVDYQGSVGHGWRHRSAPWRRWQHSARSDLAAGVTLAGELGVPASATLVLGASFGAMLGLGAVSAPDGPRVGAVVAVSPVVDLRAHVCGDLAGSGVGSWYDRRFGPLDRPDPLWDAFTPERLVGTGEVPVVVVQGEADTVVDPEASRALVDRAAGLGRPWTYRGVPGVGHRPASPTAAVTWAATVADTVHDLLDQLVGPSTSPAATKLSHVSGSSSAPTSPR